MKEIMEQMLSNHIDLSKEANTLGKNVLMNLKHSIFSLDERWELYTELVRQSPDLSIDSWVVHLKSVDEDKYTMYDHFYVDKYQTVYFTDMLETIKDEKLSVDINAFKEEVLGLGLTGFIFDW